MYTKEFKTAISELSSQEKDKLILRLLKKDLKLTNRLYFELLSFETVDDKREKLEQRIIKEVQRFKETFYSIGYLIMDIRYLSGEITEHLYITKDKYGEISLNLTLTIEVLKKHSHLLNPENLTTKSYNFAETLVARIYKILLLLNKLDEDYILDFKNNLNVLGNLVGDLPLMMKVAIHKGLDVNWLLNAEIPNNLEQIYKQQKL